MRDSKEPIRPDPNPDAWIEDLIAERKRLREENAAQAEEIERLRKRTHEIAARENARAGKAEGKLLVLERDRIAAREYLSKPALSGARFSRYIEEGIADFLHGEYNLSTENAELRARIEALEWLIVAEGCVGGECSTIPHATEICSEARAIRARREGEKR